MTAVRSLFAACLLIMGGAALSASPVQAQECAFSGTLNTNPEKLATETTVQGNPDADLLMVEFFDPNCPHCQRFHPTIQSVMESYGDRVRLHMQPVPLWKFSLDQMRAMFIAKQKDKYNEMIHAQLTSPNAGKGGMTIDQLVAIAEDIGLDAEWFRTQFSNTSTMREEVRRLRHEARKSGISKTPTVTIGKKIVSNQSADCIGQLIEQARGEAS